MRTAVFYKSYAKDVDFLRYSLAARHKFLSGADETIIVFPDSELSVLRACGLTREIIVPVQESPHQGYLYQQVSKMYADRHTDCDMLLFMDSDCIACRPFSPYDLMIDGKPRWLYTSYDKLINLDGTPATPWKPITERAIGRTVNWEFMRCHPALLPRNALLEFRAFMAKLHGCELGDYILKQPNREFSELNAFGAWAYYYAPCLFSWWNTEEKGVPEPFVRQFWSVNGVTPEIRVEIDSILK